MRYKFSLFLVIILCFGCKKYTDSGVIDQIKGDYEWTVSFKDVGLGEVHSFESSADKYGIRIEDNRKVKLFTNGDRVKTYRIISANLDADGTIIVLAEKGDDQMNLFINGDTLLTFTGPYEEYDNFYTKTK